MQQVQAYSSGGTNIKEVIKIQEAKTAGLPSIDRCSEVALDVRGSVEQNLPSALITEDPIEYSLEKKKGPARKKKRPRKTPKGKEGNSDKGWFTPRWKTFQDIREEFPTEENDSE